MALEAVLFAQGHFGYGPCGESPYALAPWGDVGGYGEFGGEQWHHQLVTPSMAADAEEWEAVSRVDHYQHHSDASTESNTVEPEQPPTPTPPPPPAGRRKRRRTKVVKNKEEIESQRMTHIAVERNRRRQMNEYLAVLRSLMPPSYAQRGDQASIVGGAINYVKELEQLLQSLQVQKSLKNRGGRSPFAGFFTFPQYSTSSHGGCGGGASTANASGAGLSEKAGPEESGRQAAEAVADIEVTMVEGHASLRVLARRRSKQLLRLVAGLQQLRIPPLHLNMTTVDAMVLYSFSLKVEDESKLGSVEDIAAAVHELLSGIQRQEEEAR